MRPVSGQIDLAPANKRGLVVRSPLLAGSGAVGLADPWPALIPADHFGAIVTAPLSWRGRTGQPQPRLAEVPGGFLLATGDQNPGLTKTLEQHSAAWARLACPLVVALSSDDRAGWAVMARHLDDEVGVAGIELQFTDAVEPREARAAVSSVRHATTLPLLAKLPSLHASMLLPACLEAGADALVVGISPTAAACDAEGVAVRAPLGGPGAFAFTWHALEQVLARQPGVPVVAAGGIYMLDEVVRCLDAGASAVQIRSLLWVDPAAAGRMAKALS